MSLPADRRCLSGRTFSSPWDPARAAAAGYRPQRERIDWGWIGDRVLAIALGAVLGVLIAWSF